MVLLLLLPPLLGDDVTPLLGDDVTRIPGAGLGRSLVLPLLGGDVTRLAGVGPAAAAADDGDAAGPADRGCSAPSLLPSPLPSATNDADVFERMLLTSESIFATALAALQFSA